MVYLVGLVKLWLRSGWLWSDGGGDGSMDHILGGGVEGGCVHMGRHLGFPMGWRGGIVVGMKIGGQGYGEVV